MFNNNYKKKDKNKVKEGFADLVGIFAGIGAMVLFYFICMILAIIISVKIHDDKFNFFNVFFLALPFGPFYILFALMSPTNWVKVFGPK